MGVKTALSVASPRGVEHVPPTSKKKKGEKKGRQNEVVRQNKEGAEFQRGPPGGGGGILSASVSRATTSPINPPAEVGRAAGEETFFC